MNASAAIIVVKSPSKKTAKVRFPKTLGSVVRWLMEGAENDKPSVERSFGGTHQSFETPSSRPE